jgi:uncharacterized membrane protein
MKKSSIFAAVAAATLMTGTAFAADMEKCNVVDENGKGLIKESKADCKTSTSSCAGHNSAANPESWISVPKGECAKINSGDFSGVDKSVKDRINTAS